MVLCLGSGCREGKLHRCYPPDRIELMSLRHPLHAQVASLMAWRAYSLRPQFVISTGDNMYPHGLNSTDDPRFDASFTSVYSAGSLQVPWHAVLGNHDYVGGSCLFLHQSAVSLIEA